MNPTAAHMLAQAIEADRRRDLRQRQLAHAARADEPTPRPPSWFDRIRLSRPRLAGSGSRA